MVRNVHLLDFHLRNGETIKNTQELSQQKKIKKVKVWILDHDPRDNQD